MSLPAWIGYVKDISAFAAVLAPISGFILTLLLMRETMARTRVHESRLPKDDEMPDE